jgi:hypothetical protein
VSKDAILTYIKDSFNITNKSYFSKDHFDTLCNTYLSQLFESKDGTKKLTNQGLYSLFTMGDLTNEKTIKTGHFYNCLKWNETNKDKLKGTYRFKRYAKNWFTFLKREFFSFYLIKTFLETVSKKNIDMLKHDDYITLYIEDIYLNRWIVLNKNDLLGFSEIEVEKNPLYLFNDTFYENLSPYKVVKSKRQRTDSLSNDKIPSNRKKNRPHPTNGLSRFVGTAYRFCNDETSGEETSDEETSDKDDPHKLTKPFVNNDKLRSGDRRGGQSNSNPSKKLLTNSTSNRVEQAMRTLYI